MKELSVQEQTTVTGGMSWEIAAMVLGLGGAILTAGGTAAAVGSLILSSFIFTSIMLPFIRCVPINFLYLERHHLWYVYYFFNI